MDRYFYSVELDGNGNKVVHMYGNLYWNITGIKKSYRHVQWTFLYLTLEEVEVLFRHGALFKYLYEKVDHLEDLTDEEAIELCDVYFDGNQGKSLHIENVQEQTKCGDYWFEAAGTPSLDGYTSVDKSFRDIGRVIKE